MGCGGSKTKDQASAAPSKAPDKDRSEAEEHEGEEGVTNGDQGEEHNEQQGEEEEQVKCSLSFTIHWSCVQRWLSTMYLKGACYRVLAISNRLWGYYYM